ncbi:MAG: N-6 DNA methylase [Faecalibacillus faecis]
MHAATYDEIVENDYNLNIPRYVDTFEEEEVIPLPDVMKELNDVRQEIEKTSKELFELLDRLEGTTPEAKAELDNFMKLLKIIERLLDMWCLFCKIYKNIAKFGNSVS